MIIDLIGWIGAILILIAYYLVSSNKTKSDDSVYQLLNLMGAVALMINSYIKGAYPITGLNIFWAIIAIKGLLKF